MMKKLRWPLLIVLLALFAIGVLLIGQQPAVLQPVVAPVIQPVKGGVYTEGLLGSAGRFNPVLDFNNPPDRDIDRLIFSGLVRFDDHGLPVGDLSDSWGISRDGTVYNFSLRPKASWHDGKPVTSDDVIFTIDMLKDDQSNAPPDVREMWKQVQVKRLDDKTLQFRLPEPFAPFMDYLTFGVLPKHLLGDMTYEEMVVAPFNLKPIGSGPYRFDRLETDQGKVIGLVLKSFDNYYGKKSYIDQIAFKFYPDAKTALSAFKEGELMGISQITSDVLPEVLKDPKLNLYTSRLPEMAIVFLNLDNPKTPFFQDSSIRRALLEGLNRQLMANNLVDGQAFLADGPIFPGTWAYYDGIEHISYNPNAAVEALKKAGYNFPAGGGSVRMKENVVLAFEMLHPQDDLHTKLAEAIQSDWTQMGISVTLKSVPYDELVNNYLNGRLYQAALVDLNLARSPDPDPYPFWHQAQVTGGQNYSKWDNRQASEYLEEGRVTVDIGERTRLYRNFQVLFSQELPALPLFYPVYTYAVSPEVQGVRVGPMFDPSDRFNTIASWFLLARRTAGKTTTPEVVIPTPTP